MKVGVILPSFRDDDFALEAARLAESSGLDGVFCYDHLWPMAQPERPALSAFPLLGAVAAVTQSVSLGPLVARVGLQPDGVLVATIASLKLVSGSRCVAAIGTGDRLSAGENYAFGVPYDSAAERRQSLERCARDSIAAGVPVWLGGGSRATIDIALTVGAAVNLWDADPDEVASVAVEAEVTWAGPVSGAEDARDRFAAVARAGATWAVCPWPRGEFTFDALCRAADAVR